MPDVKERLDVLLVKRGLAESRHRAQALILGGAVSVMGSPVMKAGLAVGVDADILVRAPGERYVSRGAHKLVAALDAFAMDVSHVTAVDVGASTGGFTDVLLRRGAVRVYAIDVGYGQLDWGLRGDERVTVMERTNLRNVESLPEAPGLAVVDVSFISLALIFPVLARLLAPDATAVTLIKPQFEAGKGRVGK
ncbi:MAG TPA: TlyA family RNA methyltransferase, partial [Chloroflexota bacterium]|nr:TlyA family RNA methyltransferase [Chloroflexota bacterium]